MKVSGRKKRETIVHTFLKQHKTKANKREGKKKKNSRQLKRRRKGTIRKELDRIAHSQRQHRHDGDVMKRRHDGEKLGGAKGKS